MDMDNLFDITHADALEIMKIEEDKMFLHRQREPGHPGCLAGVNKKICWERREVKQQKVEDKKKAASTSSTTHELSHQQLDVSFLSSDEESLPEKSKSCSNWHPENEEERILSHWNWYLLWTDASWTLETLFILFRLQWKR